MEFLLSESHVFYGILNELALIYVPVQLTKANLFQIPLHAIQKILSAPPPSESNIFRVDFRSSFVHYLNDLEEDAMYRQWRRNLNEVLFFLIFVAWVKAIMQIGWTCISLVFIFLQLTYLFILHICFSHSRY